MDLIELLGLRSGCVVLLVGMDPQARHRARDLLEAVSVNVAAAGRRVLHLGLPPLVELHARRRALLTAVSADALSRPQPWVLQQHTEIGWQPPARARRRGPPVVPPTASVLDLNAPDLPRWLRRTVPGVELICLEAKPGAPVALELLRSLGVPVLATGLPLDAADLVAEVGANSVDVGGRRLLPSLDLAGCLPPPR